MSHCNSTVIILHIYRKFIRALMIPGLHFVKFGCHHSVSDFRNFILTVQLVFFVWRGQNRENRFFAWVTLEWGHHVVLRCRAVTLRLCHLRLGLHGAKLEDPLWFGFIQIQMFFSVKEGLTHVHLISFIVTSGVKFEADVTLILWFRVVGWEVVVWLKSLIVCIDLLDIWPSLLEVKVYKTLKSFVYVVNSKQYFRSLILRTDISIRIIKGRTLSGLSASNKQTSSLSFISQITKLIHRLWWEILIRALIIPHKLIIEKLRLWRFVRTDSVIILLWRITLLGRPLLSIFHHFIVIPLCSLSWWLSEVPMVHIL
jgi:hypothetical protein